MSFDSSERMSTEEFTFVANPVVADIDDPRAIFAWDILLNELLFLITLNW